ncbi:MAG: cytochrome ubiquinol oxidase subunit I [Chloroflexi bacterium]|nr:cytochrome ubiquinol oxidase subunit I [Chloroflexota bacterium]
MRALARQPSKNATRIRVGLLLIVVVLLVLWPLQAFAQAGPFGGPAYRTILGIPSRLIVWGVAEMHLMFAAFVLGVPIFAVIVEVVGWRSHDEKYDRLAKEFTGLLAAAFATTAAFGGLLLFVLIGLYPSFMSYLVGIFNPTMVLYALVFFGETFTLYLYYYSWDRLKNRKGLHISIGVMLNIFGTILLMLADMWVTFMMAPRGIDETGALVNLREAAMGPLWTPLNVHRLLGNVAFGGFIVGAYAAFKFMGTLKEKDRAYYDWMGYTGNFIGVAALIPLPFAGYYMGREVYSASVVMGNNMMGGAFSWTFILQAVLVGILFIGANFYLWTGMRRIPGADRYIKYIKYIDVILIVCFAVWLTPHNLPLSAEEQIVVGGQYHPTLKFLGLMSAKNAVINFIIISTFVSFLLYRRGNMQRAVSISAQGRAAAVPLLIAAGVTILILGWYGLSLFNLDPVALDLDPSKKRFFTLPAILLAIQVAAVVVGVVLALRDKGHLAQVLYVVLTVVSAVFVLGVYGFVVMTQANPFLRNVAVSQWLITMSCLVFVTAIDIFLYRGARRVGAMRWGQIPVRSQFALILLAVGIVMLINLMGFVRSGLREDWHVFGVIRDTSPDAFTATNATMGWMIVLLVPAFLGLLAFLFWLNQLGQKPEIAEVRPPELIPPGEREPIPVSGGSGTRGPEEEQWTADTGRPDGVHTAQPSDRGGNP